MTMLLKRNPPITNNKSGKLSIPKFITVLFLVFSVYLVLPIIDIPLLGLSLSAPIFFIITYYCFFKTSSIWLKTYRHWILLAALIWVGIFLAAALNGLLSGGVDIESYGIQTIIRYAYWLLVFVVTTYFASQGNILPKISALLGWGVLTLALLRWGEVLLYGNIGAWTGTHLLSQNTYGFQFSTFSPFLLIGLLRYRGWKRILSGVGIITLWGAAAINGSRSSWVAIAGGLVVLVLLLFFTQPRKFLGLFTSLLFLAGLGGLLILSSPRAVQAVTARFNTFESLDADKSYAIRLLMNQKSWRLFQSSPVIGVGAGRFRLESVPLDIPSVLAYASQTHFDAITSHNSYLSFLAENGLLGAVPFAVLLVTLAWNGIRIAWQTSRRAVYWPAGVLIAFFQMSIHMWTMSTLTNTSNWFIYGLIGALIMLYRMKKNNSKTI